MNIKNPFSKKNIFWYSKFQYLINQILTLLDKTEDNIKSNNAIVKAKTDSVEIKVGNNVLQLNAENITKLNALLADNDNV